MAEEKDEPKVIAEWGYDDNGPRVRVVSGNFLMDSPWGIGVGPGRLVEMRKTDLLGCPSWREVNKEDSFQAIRFLVDEIVRGEVTLVRSEK